MKGYADKLARGGAGVTEAELRSYVRFGKEVVQKAMESTVGPERERIERLVKFSGVDPALIFSGKFAPEPPQAQPQPAPALAQAGPPQAQASQTPGFAALAKSLAGPGPAQAAPPPRAPAPATASMTGPAPAPAYSLPAQRIRDYATLAKNPDALKRQVTTMAAKLAENPEAYSQEEIDAAKIAYDRAFHGR